MNCLCLGLVVVNCCGYLLVGLSFLLFVRLNGGIVVGDRTAHQVEFARKSITVFYLGTTFLAKMLTFLFFQ
jgi:hypothetical protein